MDNINEHSTNNEMREVGLSDLSALSRLSSCGHRVLASVLGLFAASTEQDLVTPKLTGGLPSWLNSWAPDFSEMPSSPNGRPHSGVAAAKRLARKRKNQRKARLSSRNA